MSARCYDDLDVGGRCPGPAEYEVKTRWSEGVRLLCREHAAWERGWPDDVEWIRSIPVEAPS